MDHWWSPSPTENHAVYYHSFLRLFLPLFSMFCTIPWKDPKNIFELWFCMNVWWWNDDMGDGGCHRFRPFHPNFQESIFPHSPLQLVKVWHVTNFSLLSGNNLGNVSVIFMWLWCKLGVYQLSSKQKINIVIVISRCTCIIWVILIQICISVS